MSDEEAELLDNFFTPKSHGEVRLEHYDASKLIINWFDTYPLSSRILEINDHRDKTWASSFIRLYEEYVKNRTEAQLAKKLAEENEYLRNQVALFKRKEFGASSEQFTSPPIEVEDTATNNAAVNLSTADLANQDKKLRLVSSNAGRKPLPDYLPRERVEYKLPIEKQICECCSGKLREIGEEVTEQLTLVPAYYKVIQHVRQKYVCRSCDKFVTAEGNKQLITGSSHASPELLADIAAKKYYYGLPFYRLENIAKQSGIPLSRTNMANWMNRLAERNLLCIYELLKSEIRNQEIIHADETSFQVLKEPGRPPQSTSYMWLYRSANTSSKQVVIFEYQPTRSREHPLSFLTGDYNNKFNGYLLTDGYAGYNKLPNVIRVGCMAHLRRKFDEALKILPAGADGSHAQQAMGMIGELYAIEANIKDQPDAFKYAARQSQSLPVLHKLKLWLDERYPNVLSKNPLGRAIRYAVEQWDYVYSYILDGRLAIDNNIAEREIKAFVIGRKNWLFSDSVDGAKANAIMYSLVQTALANGLDPYKYLLHVFTQLPHIKNSKELESLLPWSLQFEEGEVLRIAA